MDSMVRPKDFGIYPLGLVLNFLKSQINNLVRLPLSTKKKKHSSI